MAKETVLERGVDAGIYNEGANYSVDDLSQF